MAPQNIADCRIGNVTAENWRALHNVVVSPAGVLAGHADDQGFRCSVDGWTARIGAFLGAVELACDQTTVPGQNGVGLSHTGHVLKFLAADSVADFGERGALRVGEFSPRCSL